LTGEFLPPPAKIRVFEDDLLLLTREDTPGKPEKRDDAGKVTKPAHIACSEPSVFDFIKAGQKVWIDDGRIGAIVEKLDKQGAWLRITRARQQGRSSAPRRD